MEPLNIEYLLKPNQIRLFVAVKRTARSPDLEGKVRIGLDNPVIYYICLWKTKSRESGDYFYKGLLHIDGQRSMTPAGKLSIYRNIYSESSKSNRVPHVWGRMAIGRQDYKVHMWEKKSELKEFYAGVVRLVN